MSRSSCSDLDVASLSTFVWIADNESSVSILMSV